MITDKEREQWKWHDRFIKRMHFVNTILLAASFGCLIYKQEFTIAIYFAILYFIHAYIWRNAFKEGLLK